MTDTPAEPTPAPEEPPVEIHKPKPVHNWREFLTELGTIVLGICIALAGEQVIEELRWHNQVQEARQVIATEMAQNLAGAVLRLRTEGCIERRLDMLTDILDAASRSGTLPPVGDIGQPPPRQWRSGSWESVVAAETATHFPRQELARLADLYQLMARMEGMTQFNLQAWSELYAMIGPGRRLDPASEADLRKALSLARATSRTYASMGMTLFLRTRALGLPFSGEDLKQIADARREPLATLPSAAGIGSISAICDPLGAVPPRYGQSQLPLVPTFSDQTLKTQPDFGAP